MSIEGYRYLGAAVLERAAPRSGGVALITVILAVALITTIVAAMIARQHVDIRRTANVIHANKAYEYARGVEIWATRLLARDLRREGEKIDHLGEDWARALPPTDVVGGALAGRIEDLQGRFNLNNLARQSSAASDGEQTADVDAEALARFERLLEQCGLVSRLAWSIVDWLDEDTNRSYPDGAEDYTYLGFDPPYRAANALMISPSELLLVSGFGYDAYACLSPSISALPTDTPINVNTAPIAVLRTLMDGMTADQAEQLAAEREAEPYGSVEEFLTRMKDVGLPVSEDDDGAFSDASLGVNSSYYLVTADAWIGNIRMRLFSRLERLENGSVRVSWRGRGAF